MGANYAAELHIPRNVISISAVQKFFETICHELGIDDVIRLQTELAIEEGIVILFKHAQDKKLQDLVRLRLEFFEDAIKITVKAPGRPFDFAKLSQYEPQNLLRAEDNMAGISKFLLQHLVDSMEWRYVEKEGQEFVIVKKLPVPLKNEEMTAQKAVSARQAALDEPELHLPQEILYRKVRDYDDAVALAACAYDIYRYAYKDVIYYPRELLARNEAGLMHSWIVVDSAGVIYGHYAIIKQKADDPVAEVGAAFVRAECRKGGVFRDLAEHLHTDASSLGLKGLYSLSVTNHVSTQKISERYGRKTVGIRLGSSPAVFVEGARPDERVTTVLNYCQLVERLPRNIFIPLQYREIILNSYQCLGISVKEIADEGKEEQKQEGFFEWYKDMTWNRALISARGGEVVCQKLAVLTDILRGNDIVCIMLSIDLEDASAPLLVEAALQQGYFYSGIFPESFIDGHDALQMQFLHDVKIDAKKILLYQESAKEIMAFIQQEVPGVFAESEE